MTLELHDRWTWDFWLVDDHSGTHHVFYLQAPKSIGDPEQRHWNASVGHATSSDLQTWQIHEDALGPGPAGAFDDYTTWTGSVIARDGGWAMLYTGTSRIDEGLVQRIGLATSDDLHVWHRHGDAVLEADPSRYEALDLSRWHDLAWRDPWLLADPEGNGVHAYFTARAAVGPTHDRGVIGRARSDDLRSWEILDPLEGPKGFGQLEVPQLLQLGSHWYLLFSSDVETQSDERRRSGPGTGTYYCIADAPEGPFATIGDGVLEADAIGSTYAGRIHEASAGDPRFLAWERSDPAGGFVGRLGPARPVSVRSDGSLAIASADEQ